MVYGFKLKYALDFAKEAHKGQIRKYIGEDYINHPIRVMKIVSEATSDTELLITCLLHDTVEDTAVTFGDIYRGFGHNIMKNVYYLTNCDKSINGEKVIGNRAVRKQIDNIRLSDAPPEIQTIKYADLIDNTSSIVALDPSFAKIYLKEKKAMLEMVNKGDVDLYKKALGYCDE